MPDPALATPPRRSVKEQVEAILAGYLGKQTAATAVRIASRTWLRVEPDAVTYEDLPTLRNGLQPMLKTLLGAQLASSLLERIAREVTA